MSERKSNENKCRWEDGACGIWVVMFGSEFLCTFCLVLGMFLYWISGKAGGIDLELLGAVTLAYIIMFVLMLIDRISKEIISFIVRMFAISLTVSTVYTTMICIMHNYHF